MSKKQDVKEMANVGQVWLDVLLPFANDYNIKLTASEIARKIKIPRRTVARILSKLVRLNLIRYIIEGKNKKYYLDIEDEREGLLVRMVENYKALKFSLKEKEVFVILKEILELREAVLFGSYAKGNAHSESDLDLLIIGNASKKIKDIARKQMKQVNLHFSTAKNFERLLKQKNTLAIEIAKNHIIFGSLFINVFWRFYKNEI